MSIGQLRPKTPSTQLILRNPLICLMTLSPPAVFHLRYNAPTDQCNARLPLIRAEGGERSGMVGELIAKFPGHNGDLSSLKKITLLSE